VLDDRDGRPGPKFANASPRGIEINEIIVGEFLALELLRAGKSTNRRPRRNVERGSLMRVFPLAHGLLAFE
jgi:hypothetical protein